MGSPPPTRFYLVGQLTTQNFAFRRNKVDSDFRTQGERESDLGPLSGSDTGKKDSLCKTHTDSNCWHLEENERILEAKKTTFLSW